MTLELGAEAAELLVRLPRGGEFLTVLRSVDQATGQPVAYGAGISLELVLGTTSLTATIVGADATFSLSRAAVTTLIASLPKNAKTAAGLWYTEGTHRLPWALGSVIVDG